MELGQFYVRFNRSVALALGLMVGASLSGCLDGRSDNGPGPNPAVVAAQQSDDLVDRAERLMTPVSFNEAKNLLDQAIALNPANLRAQYYSHSLNIPMQMRGILTRIDARLIEQMPYDFQQNYAVTLMNARRLPAGIQNFLFDGRVDVSTEGEVQDVVEQVTDAMAQFREFLIANKESTVVVRTYDYSNLSDPNCQVVQSTPTDAHLEGCGTVTSATFQFERPDIEMLALWIGGYEVLGAVSATYDATGAIAFGRNARDNFWTPDQILAAIDQGDGISPNIRPNNRWGDMLKISADGLQMVEYARSIQAEVCPNGVPTKKTLLWPSGLCIPQTIGQGRSLESVLRATELSLQGTPMDVQFADGQGTPNSTRVNLHALLAEAPPHQNLMPSHTNACGDMVSFFDPSINGTFPNGDVNRLLGSDPSECHGMNRNVRMSSLF